MSNESEINKFSVDKCMYKNCVNTRLSHGKRLYRFPLKTDPRCCLWIRISGKFLYIYKHTHTHTNSVRRKNKV